MKRISLFLLATSLAMPVFTHAQDAATEERFNKLSAQMDVLVEIKDAQNKRIEELTKQLRELQERQNKPNASYATVDDLKELTAKLKEIDEKRAQDNERIVKQIEALGKSVARGTGTGRTPVPPNPGSGESVPSPSKGYEYVIQSGDTLSVIVAAYREKNVKVSIDQILKANPGLQPEKMSVGKKIFIPAPTTP
jgi:LysM repeat protein